MNGFTLCAHDIIKATLVMGVLFAAIALWSGVMVLIARHGSAA